MPYILLHSFLSEDGDYLEMSCMKVLLPVPWEGGWGYMGSQSYITGS